MTSDGQFSWTLAQTGKVSVSHQQMRGIVMNKVHIECDCVSDSLLSDIVHADMQGDGRAAPSWLDSQLQKSNLKAAAAPAIAGQGGKGGGRTAAAASAAAAASPHSKTLVMRVKSAQFKDNELLLTDGELTLQGEDVIVRHGVPYFQSKSQLALLASSGPPVLTGTLLDKKRLAALAAKDGQRNLYFGNSELLDGQRPLIQNPEIHFGSHVIPMDSVARRRSSAKSIGEEMLKKLVPNQELLKDVVAANVEKQGAEAAPQSARQEGSGELSKVVLLNGRCVLKDNCIVVLHGLLHVGCAWHRVINGLLVGSMDESPHPVTITGIPVYKDATACAQMLLSNVNLYSRGSTVYACNTALLKNAVLHADGKVLGVSDLHLSSICGMDPPEDSGPALMFLQGGKFTVDESILSVLEGTVWLKDMKLQLPEDSTDEVRVKDALVFVNPDSSQDSGTKGASVFEGRDIIYKDNMLLLDDLTPLLKGGTIGHEGRQQPLAWLSGDPNAMKRAQNSQLMVPTDYPVSEAACSKERLLTEGTCIMDSNGIYFIEGSMIINGQKVMIDKGIPLFSAESKATVGDGSQHLGSLPPKLSGRVLLNPTTAKALGAKTVKGFVIMKNVQLDLTDGNVMLNNKVPIMADCKLVLNHRVFNANDLGVEPGTVDADAKDENVESGISSAESARALEISGAEAANTKPQRKRGTARPAARPDSGPARGAGNFDSGMADTPSDGQRASDLEDSGRGASDGADGGQGRRFDSPDPLLLDSQDRPWRERQKGRAAEGAEAGGAIRTPKRRARTSAEPGRANDDERRGGRSDDPGPAGLAGPGGADTSEVAEHPDDKYEDDDDEKNAAGGGGGAVRSRDPSAGALATGVRVDGAPRGPAAETRPLSAVGSRKRPEDEIGKSCMHLRVRDAHTTAASAGRFGEASSAGILGNFSVSSRDQKTLVFSMRARIDEALYFLDADD